MRCILSVLTFLLLFPTAVFAAPSLTDRFYVGASVGMRLDNSQNAAFYTASKPTFGLGHSGALKLGFSFTRKLFLETGAGRYTTVQTFDLSAPNILTEYAPLKMRMNWWHIPVRVGYVLHDSHALQISSLLGCEMIFDGRAAGSDQGFFPDQVALTPKRGIAGAAPVPGTASLFINDGHDFTALLYGGLRVAHRVGAGFSVYADAGFSMGLRHLTSATVFFGQPLVAGSSDAWMRTSIFKGDAVSLSLGMRYDLRGRQ